MRLGNKFKFILSTQWKDGNMKVYVVKFHEWCDHEYNHKKIRKIFDSMEKASSYISEHKDEEYDDNYHGQEFQIEVLEVE